MLDKRNLIGLLFVIIAATTSIAQNNMTGDLAIITTPSGAEVTLTGDVILSGVSPVRFRQLVVGQYELTVKQAGYETFHSKINIDPTKQAEVNVTLKAKTRYKALMRSAVLPGWGQRYANEGTKGFFFSLFTGTAAAAFLIADNNYRDKRDELREFEEEYDRIVAGGTIAELNLFYPGFETAQKEAYDAESTKRTTLGLLVGVYSLNLIDAMFFFPDNKAGYTVKGITIAPDTDSEKPGLKLSYKF